MFYFAIKYPYLQEKKEKIIKQYIDPDWTEISHLAKKWIGFNPVWLAKDCVRMTGYMNNKDKVLFAFSKLENYIETCYATWEVILCAGGEIKHSSNHETSC